MPRATGSKDVVSLAKGLITEASALVFPENATTDELNFLLDLKGAIRKRRLGLENEVADFTVPLLEGQTATVEDIHYWQAPDVLVIVYRIFTPSPWTGEGSPTSQTLVRIHKNNTNYTLLNWSGAGTDLELYPDTVPVQVAESTNNIVIGADGYIPRLLEWDDSTSTITAHAVNIYIRDFELVEDGLYVSERPSSLSENHQYNLYNAGWWGERRHQHTASQPFQDPVTTFFSAESVYPSNADIVSVGMSANENGVDTFRPDQLTSINVGSTEAPRGHYIYNIATFDREVKRLAKTNDGSVDNTLALIDSMVVS